MQALTSWEAWDRVVQMIFLSGFLVEKELFDLALIHFLFVKDEVLHYLYFFSQT